MRRYAERTGVPIDRSKAEIETEFMPYILMLNGKTVAESVSPLIEEAYKNHRMPKLLEALT